ncbi:MAG: helix-turn-helix domain-containing protein [Alphaproteobacteria bacterium]|nr:helix-turn-helix domain-containing protein [Alphaproteobacteria bacterium]
MILNINVPASPAALPDNMVVIEHAVPAQHHAVVNLHVADEAAARKLRVFLDCEGQKRELIERVSASAYASTMTRLICAALNISEDFADRLDGFEKRLIGILAVGSDCLLSTDDIAKALEAFYEGFTSRDIDQAIAELRGKLAKAGHPLAITGEPESGYRLQSPSRLQGR